MIKRAGVFLVVLGLFANGLIFGADKSDARNDALIMVRGLNSALTAEKMLAIQGLSQINNPSVIDEFKVVDKFKEFVASDKQNFVIRRAALTGLVELDANGIQIPDLLDIINSLLQSDGVPFQLRIISLQMLTEVVRSHPPVANRANPTTDRALLILKNLWKGRRDLPTSLRVGILQALGGFGNEKSARTMLMDALKDPSQEVVEAALTGLKAALQVTESMDARMAEDLQARFLTAVKNKNMTIAVLSLDCLQIVSANINRMSIDSGRPKAGWLPSKPTVSAVEGMLRNGTDPEVVSAVKFLMGMTSRDPKVAMPLLEVATPSASRPLSYETINIVNSALIDVLLGISDSKTGAKKYKDEANRIIKHMIDLLKPDMADKVPAELRKTMILGLSCIPVDFDRVIPVQSLIALLGMEAKQDNPSRQMIRDIEVALTSLTGVAPFQIVVVKAKEEKKDAGPTLSGVEVEKITMPDVDRWIKWFDANKAKLVAGKVPYK